MIEKRDNKKLPPEKQKKRNPAELIKLGLKYLPENEESVKAREPFPEPGFDAVIIYIADVSGSMTEEHRKVERLVVKNQRAMFKVKYPHLKEVFIRYSDKAEEVTEKEFFTQTMGGGTATVEALKLAEKVLERYPRARYNRYVQIFSDGDDFQPAESSAHATRISKNVDFFVYGNIDPQQSGRKGPLSNAMETLSQSNPDVAGYADVSLDPRSIFQAIKKWFGQP